MVRQVSILVFLSCLSGLLTKDKVSTALWVKSGLGGCLHQLYPSSELHQREGRENNSFPHVVSIKKSRHYRHNNYLPFLSPLLYFFCGSLHQLSGWWYIFYLNTKWFHDCTPQVDNALLLPSPLAPFVSPVFLHFSGCTPHNVQQIPPSQTMTIPFGTKKLTESKGWVSLTC